MTRFQPRRPAPLRVPVTLALAALAVAAATRAAELPPALAGSGVAVVPADAAFLSATLRAREQFDRFTRSNAYAALRGLPAVKRALDSFEEQRSMPGSPVSMADTFLQLPENAEAMDLLADMVATDTFVYGEPSCVAFAKLVRRVSAAVQAAGVLDDGDDAIIEEEFEIIEDDDDGSTAAMRRAAARGMHCQFGGGRGPSAGNRRVVVEALAENLDLIVVPDVVWGFKTTMPDAAKKQIRRLETLAKMAAGNDPDMADAVARRQVAGGEFLVLTLRGERLPWEEIERGLGAAAEEADGLDDVLAKLRGLDLCLALGVVGDRVILSFGDSTDHLQKLVAGDRLVGLPALAPLLAHAERKLTGISYSSAAMNEALAQDPEDITRQFAVFEQGPAAGVIPEEAVEDLRDVVGRFAKAIAARLPQPGPWLGFSFLTDSGYEGFAWDWAKNQPVDGGRRLDLLEHAGGAPLSVVVARSRADDTIIDDLADLCGGLWGMFDDHVLPTLDADDRERAAAASERAAPLAERFEAVLKNKLAAALADGQGGFVIDAKSRTKKPHRDLPPATDPLPLPEAAVVLPLKDAKLFREGLSDLFALADDAAAVLEDVAPDAVPPGGRLPDPEKAKVEAGTLWSFPLKAAGLDDQVRPTIGVGDKAAVFALTPKQATRLLGGTKLETGSQLSTFEEPLALAAAWDVAGTVEAIKPWVVYLVRYGCVVERDGRVDPDTELKADDETEQAREALAHAAVALDVAQCLRAFVSETAVRDGAVVCHWRNVIRDLPKKP